MGFWGKGIVMVRCVCRGWFPHLPKVVVFDVSASMGLETVGLPWYGWM